MDQIENRRPFGVGALWEHWQPEEGKPVESCAVITTPANDLVRPINARMPVVVAPEDYDAWLDPEFFDLEDLERMMRPFGPEGMTVVPG